MENEEKEFFENIKNKVAREYKNIGSIYNPALKSNIRFNSNGFYHLRYDNNRSERNKKVQLNKLRFFNEAVRSIKISTTIQEYRRLDKIIDSKRSIVEWFAFWTIISFVNKIRIKVIVRRVGGKDGQFHFWSVMPFWSLRHNQKNIGSVDLDNE